MPTLTVQRFFEIEGIRKAMLLAFNLFICLVPLLIITFGLLSNIRRNISLGQVFVEQFHLRGEAARVVRQTFPENRSIVRVASFIVVASFAISGFDVASIFERTFAEAWQVTAYGGVRGALRGAAWFVTVFATFGLSQALQRFPSKHGAIGYLVTVPVVLLMNFLFWLITPRLLLDKELDWDDLKPGAVMGMIASTVLWGMSLAILPGWFDWYGRGFGSIGIALAMLAWTYVVAVVWVVIVTASAAYWERTATVEEVLELELGDTGTDEVEATDGS